MEQLRRHQKRLQCFTHLVCWCDKHGENCLIFIPAVIMALGFTLFRNWIVDQKHLFRSLEPKPGFWPSIKETSSSIFIYKWAHRCGREHRFSPSFGAFGATVRPILWTLHFRRCPTRDLQQGLLIRAILIFFLFLFFCIKNELKNPLRNCLDAGNCQAYTLDWFS